MLHALATFAIFSFLLTAVPGPDTMLVLRNLLSGGRRAGMWTATGAYMGSLVWGAAAAVGITAVLLRSAAAYETLRLAGAAYLILLRLSALRARQAATDPMPASNVGEEKAGPVGRWPALRAGLLSDLLNPKVGLFFVAVIPQFLPAGHSAATTTLLFAGLDIVIALAWFAAVIPAAGRILHLLRRPRVRRGLERVTGCVLIGLGVSVAAEHT